MTLVIIGAVLFGLWKLGPKHLSTLGGDVLKLEWIRELQARKNKRDQEEMTCEEALTRFSRKLIASGVTIFALTLLVGSGLTMGFRLIVASIASAAFVAIGFRLTRHRRRVLLPLYLTLARIPGTRWDVHSPCQKWLRVPAKSGRPIIVRLPMDFHCGPMQAKLIQEVVTTRVPGTWKMEAQYPKFMLKFHPVTTSVVDVGPSAALQKDMGVSLGGLGGTLLGMPLEKLEMEPEELESPW